MTDEERRRLAQLNCRSTQVKALALVVMRAHFGYENQIVADFNAALAELQQES